MSNILFFTTIVVLAIAAVSGTWHVRKQRERRDTSGSLPKDLRAPLKSVSQTVVAGARSPHASFDAGGPPSATGKNDDLQFPYFRSEGKALAHLRASGADPDILECTFQTSDFSPHDDYLDGFLAAYPEEKLLRFAVEGYEGDEPWHIGETPWSDAVAVIRRARNTPHVSTNVKQADGTYARKGQYVQTRVYTLSHGITYRILNRDPDEMHDDEPFYWLKRHMLDDGVRYFEDTQEDPLFGEGPDGLDEASYRAESREQVWDRIASRKRKGA